MFSTTASAQEAGHEVTAKAEVTKVAMYLQKLLSATSERMVVFEVTLKNVSDSPLRYSVKVLIPRVGGGEDFAPAEAGQIAAGMEGTARVGVVCDRLPTQYRLVVRTVD